KMRGVMWQVQEERPAGLARVVDELQRKTRPEVWRVPVLAKHRCISWRRNAVEVQRFAGALGERRVLALVVLIGEVHSAGVQTERPIESAHPWRGSVVLTQMPLAGHDREVPGLAEDLWNRHRSVVEPAR